MYRRRSLLNVLSQTDPVWRTIQRRVRTNLTRKDNAKGFEDYMNDMKNARYKKPNIKPRIAGWDPIRIEMLKDKIYYWCSCGYSKEQVNK
ncbi:unnamed protein product [Didymodactylos carnosus]|uniref:Uncharacterized protein n=1 Tax=Didymodactylos carnosus TaxID=1234261 RepID=A0A8S2IL38_9BILA|nr:unnamed protein product [Didymodactylos carnosus]CAF3743914.1 unnamed protein product [Didymodactylos carnosus]